MLVNVVMNLISAYAPQVGCEERVNAKSFVRIVFMTIPVNKELIIGGDLNGHVGRIRGNYVRVHRR